MATYARAHNRRFILIVILLFSHSSASLKCRTDDGISDAELKRVTRTCMRKIGESLYYSNSGSTGNTGHHAANFNSHYGTHHQTGYGSMSYNNKYDYDGDDDSSSDDGYNYKTNNNNNNYDRNEDFMRQRNRDRMQMSRTGSRSDHGGNSMGGRHPSNGNNGSNGYGGSHGNSGNGGGGGGHGNSNSGNGGGGHGNSNSGNGAGGHGNSNSGNGSGGGGYQRSTTTHGGMDGGGNNRNTTGNESACVVHCFFDEMNMLNQDDYPDRHKVQYILTKDLRDRELRDFYVDTIQQCFRYLESQRRREKCLYSRDLINCMAEYARGSCDDWQEFNMMFN